jgi:hypothetical protein
VNVATRATDMDTKDIQVQSEKPGAGTEAFLLSLKNRNWMEQSRFGVFLNKFSHTRTKYGGVLVKKTEKNGELTLDVMQWRNMITDQVDIANGVKIERHYYTPAELKEMAGAGWNNIDDAIAMAKNSQEAIAANSPSTKNRTPGSYIEVFEVHGVLPDCYLPNEKDDEQAGENQQGSEAKAGEDKETYSRQMHIVVLAESDKDNNK